MPPIYGLPEGHGELSSKSLIGQQGSHGELPVPRVSPVGERRGNLTSITNVKPIYKPFFDPKSQVGMTEASKPLFDKEGTGLGFVYDKKLVGIALARPETSFDDYLDDQQRDFFRRTLTAPDGVSTQLPASEHAYAGGWYPQGFEPTCLPWAVANASYALGKTPHEDYLVELLNYANDIEQSKREGMNYGDAIGILTKHPNAGIQLTPLPFEELLKSLPQRPQDEGQKYIPFIIEDTKTPEEITALKEQTYESVRLEVIKRNGAIVKRIIDADQALLTSVLTKPYTSDDKPSDLHAIAVVGYKIGETGNMDVQVIDPARGKLWMSLEHLSASVFAFSGYTMSKSVSGKQG